MLQKRLNYKFNGYNVPFVPKARRSIRRRGPLCPEDDDTMSAFDLLATVAGKLLQGERSEDVCPVKDRSSNVENAENKEHGDISSIDEERFKIPDLNEIVEQCDDDDRKIVPRISSTIVTRDSIPSSRGNNNVGVLSRNDNDDDNSYVCKQPSTITSVRPRSRIGDRRIRRLLASRYWRVPPICKNRDRFDTELCSVYRRRKFGYKHKRSRRIYSLKNKSFCYKSFSNSSEKFNDVTRRGVKLGIKSFRVPEFVVEMPETATVGSLKMSVMEAVKALIRDGLRIGVLVKGKKIRDETTLLQSGISLKSGSLGFTLEPLSRAPAPVIGGESRDSSYKRVTNMGNCIESDYDLGTCRGEGSGEKGEDDIRALGALCKGAPEMLGVVSGTQKSTEIGQRRVRRPFSVAEVEALVQAVEELGTGRWRDVKQHAFNDVNYRTYVDLKDKWKTLVHTARISAQQRRGQPVPQQLLERVLAIHQFWSQQLLKHPKHEPI